VLVKHPGYRRALVRVARAALAKPIDIDRIVEQCEPGQRFEPSDAVVHGEGLFGPPAEFELFRERTDLIPIGPSERS
jgi:hypothetical protein